MIRFLLTIAILLVSDMANAGHYELLNLHVMALRSADAPTVVVPDVKPGQCSNCSGTGRVGDGTVSVVCPECDGTGKTGVAQEENQYGAMGDGMIDRARDRAIIKAGLTWEKIQFIAAEAFSWALKSKAIRTAVESPSQSYAMAEASESPKPKTAYQRARQQAIDRGVPLVLFITQDGCKPCKEKLANVIEPMKYMGWFDGCELQVLNRSTDETAAFLAGVKGSPQVIVYKSLDGVSKGSRLTGPEITADRIRSLLKGKK